MPVTESLEERRKRIEQFFIPENAIADSHRSFVSPSGEYSLGVELYRRPTGWAYSRGIVRRIADQAVIADIKRNYVEFWHAWVDHPNGNEYLLCGEDYQGYSIVNLTQGTIDIYLPPEAFEGSGFCWASVCPSPDGLVLAVYGCYWAGPHEIALYDFSQPECLPLPEIDRLDPSDKTIDGLLDWEDNRTLIYRCSYDVRMSDGAVLDNLPDEEQEEAIRERDVGFRTEIAHWIRPTV